MADGWPEVIAPLASLVDLDETARTSGALVRLRGVRSAETLLRLAMAWAAGGLSLRRSAAWAGVSGLADLSDSALLRRLRKAGDWLDLLVQAILRARVPEAEAWAAQGRLIRIVDGSTFSVRGADQPGWRLHAGFDLPSGRMGRMVLTTAAEGEALERIAVTAGEVRIGDRGFARPEGLRHVVEQGGDVLVRIGSRSLKLAGGDGIAFDLTAALAAAERDGLYEADIFVIHGRKSRKHWPPLPVRLIIKPLPPAAAEAARARLRRAGQRERYDPSPQAFAAAGHVMLVTTLGRDDADADTLLALYRLRWQVELAFKRLKSLLDMRCVPTRNADLTRTWLYANLLVALLAEDFSAEFGDFSP